VIILTWNARTETESCVESVLQLDHDRFDVLVIDNDSRDGTVEALQQRFGDRILLQGNSRNLLFAGGMNVGLTYALSHSYDSVLMLNNDVLVDPPLLRELLVVLRSANNIAAVGPKIFYVEPADVLWFAGADLSLWKGWPQHRGLRQKDTGAYDQIEAVDYLTGAGILFRREALETVGLLDVGYGMYAEDADWAFRARQAGYRVVYAPKARMWHHVSAAAGAASSFKIRMRLRSQWRFLRRHASWYHWLTIPFGTIAEFTRVGWRLIWRSR
jgi:GT2 family glycosyltransferase